MPQIVEVNSIAELDHYRHHWNHLLSQTRRPSFFQTLEWLTAYWKHYGAERQLRTLIVYSDGEPIGIVPLVIEREPTRLGTVRVLTYPLHDWGTFFGPIGPQPAVTLCAAFHHLAETPRHWDLLDMRFVDPEIDHGRTPEAMKLAGFGAAESDWKATALVEFTGNGEDFWESLTSKLRNNLRRLERRLAEQGEVVLERYRPAGAAQGDGDPRWDLYDECVRIAALSWQGKSETGTTLSTSSVADFFRTSHEVAASTGNLDLALLRVGGRAIAFSYNYQTENRLTGMRIGYDPEYSKAGAGTILYLYLFRDSCDRGDLLFDMGVGSLDIKRCWMTRQALSRRYTHYSLAPRVQLLRLKHWFDRRSIGAESSAHAPLAETDHAQSP